ncbi:hypothetical protein FRB95_002512 [Tulasnella sp. JGI-2019a]|nr:hypothetical protein FRB93_004840 [Tulasnella sp. JGI-2019a]KAG9031583.1 hypothetical protein FRB95_002512 [Tulasnella sp. JGI-2019a]
MTILSTTAGPYDPDNLPEGVYHWNVDETQADRLSKMLKVDFATLGVTGTYVMGPQVECHGCGKLSGLDDFVSGASKFGIHSTEFMIDALLGEGENKSPTHKLECCVCGETFREGNAVNAKQLASLDPGSQKAAMFTWAGYWRVRLPPKYVGEV